MYTIYYGGLHKRFLATWNYRNVLDFCTLKNIIHKSKEGRYMLDVVTDKIFGYGQDHVR
jgi:hypothetical protein